MRERGGLGEFSLLPRQASLFYGSSRTHAEANKSHRPNASVAKSQPQKNWRGTEMCWETFKDGIFSLFCWRREGKYAVKRGGWMVSFVQNHNANEIERWIDNWMPDLAGEDLAVMLCTVAKWQETGNSRFSSPLRRSTWLGRWKSHAA